MHELRLKKSIIAHAGLSRNRHPTTALNQNETPYERCDGKKPDVSHLPVFGCNACANVPDGERRKLDKKSKNMRFVGYGITSKGYRLFDNTN